MLGEKLFEATNEDPHWDKRESPAPQYLQLLKDLGVDYEGKTMLDIGCANGTEVGIFRECGILADGIDKSEKFVREAQKSNPEASFVIADAQHIPIKNESYDIVYSTNTLFFTDIEKSIPEYCRILKKGGHGVISFDTHIENLNENTAMHDDSLEHLKQALEDASAQIIMSTGEEKREDEEQKNSDGSRVPKHEHTFHKIVFKMPL